MKTLTIFAAALLSTGVLMADAALADGAKTREQVISELVQARDSGELARLNSEDTAAFLRTNTVSTKTRAQVLAELKQAQDSGELALLNSDDPTASQRLATLKANKRAEALAE